MYNTEKMYLFAVAVASMIFQTCSFPGLLPSDSLDMDLRQACTILPVRCNAALHIEQTCLGHHLSDQKQFRITINAMLLPV